MVGTSFFVSHNKKVFIYDINESEVINEFEFEATIVKLLRIEYCEGSYSVGVIL